MTTVAETRILPEELETTWKRMRAAFAEEQSSRATKAIGVTNAGAHLRRVFVLAPKVG